MAMDRGILDQQLQALGEGPNWWVQREMRDLPAVLRADEEIHAIARGRLGRLRGPRPSWLMIVTNQRLLCLRSSYTTWRQFEIGAHQINSVTLRIRLFGGRLLIVTSDRTFRFQIHKADGQKLVNALARVASCGQDTLSGPTHMVRRIVNHMLALPSAALNTYSEPRKTRVNAPVAVEADARVHAMEERIQELQQQVEFLEQLLRQRQAATTEAALHAGAERASSGRTELPSRVG
jgi:hypothetical protein